jgi:hypothetical protein
MNLFRTVVRLRGNDYAIAQLAAFIQQPKPINQLTNPKSPTANDGATV